MPPMSSRSYRARFVLAAALALAAVGAGCSSDESLAEQQAEVADRGAEVMPFDLDATTHVFTKTDRGGVQVVTADDPGDQRQIDLIREHLTEERDGFARGDFDDPAQIHGHDMPGVAELTAGYADVVVTYAEAPAGAELTYTTDDAALVDAIHAWFDRQLLDHGDDAEPG
jgi:hypothetical protein